MRKYLIVAMALGALLALTMSSFATAERPVTVRAGKLILTFNGGFFPKKLPKKRSAPIGLSVSGKLRTSDGSHPPALKEFLLETDKNGSVQTKGYPTCKPGKLQARNSAKAEAVCKPALIGEGKTGVEIEFAESSPVDVNSKLLMFNGGTRGGTTTFYIHAYITVPTPAAIVTTVKIKKIHKGRYGLLATAKIPRIAGGSGSVTSFNLKVVKKYRFKGKKLSILNLRCADGKVQARGEARFSDGTKAKAEVIRTCTPTG